MIPEAFQQRFSMDHWFDAFCRQLSSDPVPTGDEEIWTLSFRRSVLEALSDSGAELFLNPLMASHLRHFGRQLARHHAPEKWFWVRSEWDKADLAYGLAAPFDAANHGWNEAWLRGITGDLGQIEAKVCYTHFDAGQIRTLADQLRTRKKRDWQNNAPHRHRQRYHGVVWLFQHGGIDGIAGQADRLTQEACGLGLTLRRPFGTAETAVHLGRLWPSQSGKDYVCGVSLALFELAADDRAPNKAEQLGSATRT